MLKFYQNLKRITVALHEDICTFVISCRIIIGMKMHQTEDVEKIRTYFLCSMNFSPQNCAIYGVMQKNVVGQRKPNMTIYLQSKKDAIFMLDS
jgi:hypothetical protein